jgi:Pyruvate/2-oxoacid:ferredoxin oxidoreductase delta subunit
MKRRGASAEIARIKSFNRSYYGKEAPVPLEERDSEERVKDMAEYFKGLRSEDVQTEAARCIKCGTCIQCDNCHLFCPDAAIVKRDDGNGYEILCDYCKGCGVCVEECPRGGIHMRRVEHASLNTDADADTDADAAGDPS